MKRKLPVMILVLAAVAGGTYWTTRVRSRGVQLTGIVTTEDVIVSSQIQGRLAQLLVKEGDPVNAGELVALIEPGELRADRAYYAHTEENASAQVQAAEGELKFQEAQTRDQVRQAEAALAATEAQQAEATADLERAHLELERTQSLFKQNIVALSVLDQARTTHDASKAHVDSMRKQVEAQRAALALARSTAEQIAVRRSQLLAGQHQLAAMGAQKARAQVRLSYTEIHAPISGVVALRAARQGEVVNPGQAILSLIDPDDLWVRADVEETYIDGVRLGDRMPVRLPSGVERIGTVFFRGVDAGYATQRDVSRTKRDIKTFEIRLRVDNTDRRLWPGLTALVTLPIETAR